MWGQVPEQKEQPPVKKERNEVNEALTYHRWFLDMVLLS